MTFNTMNIYSFIIVWGRMAKTAAEFAKDLCDITANKPFPFRQKKPLFDTIFEIFKHDATHGLRGKFWESVTYYLCRSPNTTIKSVLETLMYKDSKQLISKRILGHTKYITVVSQLFLELILHLMKKINQDKTVTREFLKNMILTVEHSDTAAILNIAIDDVDSFLKLTTEDKETLLKLIRNIDGFFLTNNYTRIGNYSLAHIIRSLCKGIIRKKFVKTTALSDDEDDDDDDDDAAAASAASSSAASLNEWTIIDDVDEDDDDTPIQTKRGPTYFYQQYPVIAITDQRQRCKYDGQCYQNMIHHGKYKHLLQDGPLPYPSTGGVRLNSKMSKLTRHSIHAPCRRSSSKRTPRRRPSTKRRTRRRHRH